MNIKLKNALSKLEKSKDLAVRTYEEWSVLDEHVGHEELGITKENLRDCVAQSKEDIETFEIAIEAIKEKIEKQENEPLTLEQLENMLGDPVWDNYYKRWELLINFDKWTDVDGEIELELSSGMTYYSEKRFYKHKPVEVEHA